MPTTHWPKKKRNLAQFPISRGQTADAVRWLFGLRAQKKPLAPCPSPQWLPPAKPGLQTMAFDPMFERSTTSASQRIREITPIAFFIGGLIKAPKNGSNTISPNQ